MKTLAIIGAGELGRQIAHFALSDNHYGKVVFFDDVTELPEIDTNKIIGKTSDVEKAYGDKQFDELLIGIGYKHLEAKAGFYEKFADKIPFGTIIHSSCWVDLTAAVEPGCVIYPGCIIDKKAVVKANCVLNLGCTIAHDSVIGSHSFLSPDVAVAGFVEIGAQCNIGINTTIIDNIKIIEKTQTGGGTVVIKDITQSGLYVGNPAKLIKS